MKITDEMLKAGAAVLHGRLMEDEVRASGASDAEREDVVADILEAVLPLIRDAVLDGK